MAQNQFNVFNQSCWNCSTSLPQGTTAAPHVSELLSHDEVIILSVICALASVMGTFGNFLVLLAVRKNEVLRTIPDLFITSLAFSDFSVCALFLPMSIYAFNHSENEIFAIVKSFLGHTSMVASATNMFAVTVDRVIAIRYPFKYVTVMTTRNALVGILVVWIISLVFGALYAPNLVSRMYIALYSATLLLTTMSMYIYIFIIARRQENRIQNIQQGSNGTTVEKKVAKTIFTVVGIYALFWLPVLLLPIIINPATESVLFVRRFQWVQTMLVCNSAINPYIYCMRSKKYRTAFGKILRIQHYVDRNLTDRSLTIR